MLLTTFFHEVQLMFFRVIHTDPVTKWESLLLLLFSLIFMLGGIARWVEFLDFGFSKMRRSILIILHISGCIVLALAFALLAIDLDKRFSSVGSGLLASALVLLFPLHIYIGLLRRIRNNSPSIGLKVSGK